MKQRELKFRAWNRITKFFRITPENQMNISEKLNYMEKNILRIIAETHAHSTNEVEKVYEKCKSFDLTIKILKESTAHALALEKILLIYGFSTDQKLS